MEEIRDYRMFNMEIKYIYKKLHPCDHNFFWKHLDKKTIGLLVLIFSTIFKDFNKFLIIKKAIFNWCFFK